VKSPLCWSELKTEKRPVRPRPKQQQKGKVQATGRERKVRATKKRTCKTQRKKARKKPEHKKRRFLDREERRGKMIT